jgi:hypothetical protein
LFSCRSEDDLLDDNNSSGMANTRHITHDDRLIPAITLHRRLQELSKYKFCTEEHFFPKEKIIYLKVILSIAWKCYVCY